MKHITPLKPFAEIIESSLRDWHAQCWNWDVIPRHGSILTVKEESRTIFGLVHAITTGSKDAHRTTFAYKKSEAELKKDHPQIFEFLKTTFTCITLGYKEQTSVRYHMAPLPPKIHAFVTTPDEDDLHTFFKQEHYIASIFAHTDTLFSLDDLLLALLEYLSQHKIVTRESFSRFIQTFSLLTGNDYRRLKLFLQRAQPLISYEDLNS